MLSWEGPTGTALLQRANLTEYFQLGTFPFPPIPASSWWVWSLTSTNHPTLSHLPISNLPLRQQLLCQGLPRLWLLLETPFKKQNRRAVTTKGGGGKGGHTGHFTPALLCLLSFCPRRSKGIASPQLTSGNETVTQVEQGAGRR